MIAQKHQKPSKRQPKIQLKLPEINPRRHVQSAKKNPLLIPHLPQINSISNNKNILINKENHSLNLVHRRNSFDEEIKARLIQVEEADKMVKNILGGPEATVNVGGDMTNFQMKVQANKDFIKRQRKRSYFQQHNPNIPSEQRHQNPSSPKYKSVSSKDLFPIPHKIKQSMKLKIHENHEIQTARQVKNQKEFQNQEANKKRFKSQRKPVNHQKKPKDQNSEVFNSIKQILSNPQKNLDVEATKVKKLVKFTIQELENRLKKMENIEGNKSYFEGIGKKNDKSPFDRKLSSAKSVGMIPVSALPMIDEQTFKHWNKIQISQQNEGNGQNTNRVIKYHKSNFNQQVDQIQKLEMKSYKSIQKMVQNRKLLLDLQLMKKNKSSVLTIQSKNKEISV